MPYPDDQEERWVIPEGVSVMLAPRYDEGKPLKDYSTYFLFRPESCIFWPGKKGSPQYLEREFERKMAEAGKYIGFSLPLAGFPDHSSVWARMDRVKRF